MRRMCLALAAGLLAGLAGCAANSISGSGARYQQVFQGSISIVGESHEVTIQSGSKVPKLSILGEDVRVTIEPGAAVVKIEVAGDDNEIICPEGLNVEFATTGDDNRLIRR